MNNALPRRAAAGRVSKGEGGRRPCLEGWTPPRLVRPFETPRSAWLLRVRSSLHVAINNTLTLRAAAGRVSKGEGGRRPCLEGWTPPRLVRPFETPRSAWLLRVRSSLYVAINNTLTLTAAAGRVSKGEGGRGPRFEGWQQHDWFPSFETPRLRVALRVRVWSAAA